jgi:hypothetical protein
VFGVGSIITPSRGDPDKRSADREQKLQRLIRSLERLAAEQGEGADIKLYEELDLLVVKSSDQRTLDLIAEAIAAIKADGRGTGAAGPAREQALLQQVELLQSALHRVEVEGAAQRQTLVDQINLLQTQQGEAKGGPPK